MRFGRVLHALLTIAIFLTIAIGVPHHLATEHHHDVPHDDLPVEPAHDHHDGPEHTSADHEVLATVKAPRLTLDLKLAAVAVILVTEAQSSAPAPIVVAVDRSDPSPPHLHHRAFGPTSPRAPPTLRV